MTRAILIEEIKLPGLSIRERDLLPEELESADQVFMTSTTRDLMPVVSVDGRPLAQNPAAMGRLSAAFHAFVDGYVANRASEVAHR